MIKSLPIALGATLCLLAGPGLPASSAISTAASPSAAAARSVLTQPDPTGDVWLHESPDFYSEHGPRDNVDLTASRVRHAPRRVIATAWYSDLVRTTDTTTTEFHLRTDTGRLFRLRHTTGPGNRSGRFLLTTRVNGKVVDRSCAGVRHVVNHADDLVRMSVPRPCLGRPAWVRYLGSATAVEEGPGATYVDNMSDSGPVNDLYSRRIPRA